MDDHPTIAASWPALNVTTLQHPRHHGCSIDARTSPMLHANRPPMPLWRAAHARESRVDWSACHTATMPAMSLRAVLSQRCRGFLRTRWTYAPTWLQPPSLHGITRVQDRWSSSAARFRRAVRVARRELFDSRWSAGTTHSPCGSTAWRGTPAPTPHRCEAGQRNTAAPPRRHRRPSGRDVHVTRHPLVSVAASDHTDPAE